MLGEIVNDLLEDEKYKVLGGIVRMLESKVL